MEYTPANPPATFESVWAALQSFYPDVEKECVNQGIAIIKQVGDSVVINDEGLKVY